MKNGCVEDEFGNKFWYKNGILHREDGPAVELVNGIKEWYLNGHLHRESGPAIDRVDGTKRWYHRGKLHREDGPAVELTGGGKLWNYKGIRVGEGDAPDPIVWERVTSVEINGGPLLNGCVVDVYNVKYWFKDDKLHREDGPAVEYRDGSKGWYLNGKSLGSNVDGFWELWDRLTDEQRGNTTLLKYLPR